MEFFTSGADGVSISFIRENGTLVFRAVGLPKEPTGVEQVIAKDYNLEKFRYSLYDLLYNWPSSASDRRAAAEVIYDSFPEVIKTLSMQ